MWLTLGLVAAGTAIAVYAAMFASTHHRRAELRGRILQLACDIDEIARDIERDVAGLESSITGTLVTRIAQVAAVPRAVLERRKRLVWFSLRRLERGEVWLHQGHADVIQLRCAADALLSARRRTLAGALSST